MDILKNKDIVLQLLREEPELRDSDQMLIANVWNKELMQKGLSPKTYMAYHFLQVFAKGEMAHPESIMRIRRKLQQEFPELRGLKWKERQKFQKDVVEQLYQTPEILAGGTP